MKVLAAAALAAFLATGASVQADPVRYDFNQAFWGLQPSTATDAAAWQAGREAAVALNPTDFFYMTGGFDFLPLNGPISDFALTVDYGPVSHTFTLNNPLSDYYIPSAPGVDFQIYTSGYQIRDSFGPVLSFGDLSDRGASDEQYRATLDISFVFDKRTGQLTTTASTRLEEFEQKELLEFFFFDGIPLFIPYTTGGYASREAGVFTSYSQPVSAPLDPSVVPLPATGWLMLSVGLGMAVMHRRRQTV